MPLSGRPLKMSTQNGASARPPTASPNMTADPDHQPQALRDPRHCSASAAIHRRPVSIIQRGSRRKEGSMEEAGGTRMPEQYFLDLRNVDTHDFTHPIPQTAGEGAAPGQLDNQ